MTRRLVSTREAAQALGVSPATIWDWRRQGLVEPAGRNRWDLRALRSAQRAPKPYRAGRPPRRSLVTMDRQDDVDPPCPVACDVDCPAGATHCQWTHEPKHKLGWHDPANCDTARSEQR